MSDLGLTMDSTRSAHRPGRRRRRIVAVLVVLLIVAGLASVAVVGGSRLLSGLGASPDFPGPGEGSVVVEITPGESLSEIGATLAGAGVVQSAGAFSAAAKGEPRSRSVQPGFYQLKAKMSAAGALTLLLDPVSSLRGKVVVPEGTPVAQVLAIAARGTDLTMADLTAAARDTASLGLPEYADGHLEGYLFPATYPVDPSTTATSLLTAMVTRFTQAATTLRLEQRAAALGVSPTEVVKVASMIEKEAAVDGDFGKVARVAYNRLAIGMKLQFDSTLNYALEVRKGNLSLEDIKIETPYNSYLTTGLPPTAISNPGSKALEAALDPTPGNWIYFVTVDKAGNAFFTENYTEFLKAKAEGKRVRG